MNLPTRNQYRSEINISEECSKEQAYYCQNIIGVMCWVVKLVRIGITFEVSSIYWLIFIPRAAYLIQDQQIFKYLDINKDSRFAFDMSNIIFQSKKSPDKIINDMNKIYPDAMEDLPTNSTKLSIKWFQMNFCVESDHAGDKFPRLSHTGILISLNHGIFQGWYIQ